MIQKFVGTKTWRIGLRAQKKIMSMSLKSKYINDLIWRVKWHLVRVQWSYKLKRVNSEDVEKYPKITIITPNYNQGRFLEKCIQSVLYQNYPNLEYIVIDAKSTDNSLEVIRKYSSRLKYWVSEKDNGQADAINKGLKHTTGDIVNWLNSDDFLEPNALYRCAESYQVAPSAVGWIGACRRIHERIGTLNVIYPNGLDRENIGQNWNGRQFYQPSCFLSTPKVKKIGGVNNKLNIAFDLDLWIRILEEGDFSIGSGIWSNAIIHSDAKTQKLFVPMHLETIEVQKNHGFQRGAASRFQRIFKNEKFKYICPDNINIVSKTLRKKTQWCHEMPKKKGTLLFFSNFLPKFDIASSLSRNHGILRILLSRGIEILYVYCIRTNDDDKYLASLKGNIKYVFLPRDKASYKEMISDGKFELIWITNLWHTSDYIFFTQFVNTLKLNKYKGRIIVDTRDFHYKKYMRKYKLSRSKKDYQESQAFLKAEKSLYSIADLVLTVSEKEAKNIKENIREIASTGVVPNIYDIYSGVGGSYTESQNICYLGNFQFNHNRDAVYYFLDKIFNRIVQADRSIEFHIIGAGSENMKGIKENKHIRFKGYVKELKQVLTGYRLLVCPMTYGSGMKGQIGVAASVGLPIVTTSIGAEGYPLKDGENCFIADSPIEFADKCKHLISDPVAWNNFSVRSRSMIRNYCSTEVVSQKLNEVFSENNVNI